MRLQSSATEGGSEGEVEWEATTARECSTAGEVGEAGKQGNEEAGSRMTALTGRREAGSREPGKRVRGQPNQGYEGKGRMKPHTPSHEGTSVGADPPQACTPWLHHK